MQLSFKGWSPLATHIACVLIGITIANFAKVETSEKVGGMPSDKSSCVKVARGKTLLALPLSVFARAYRDQLKARQALALVAVVEDETPSCLWGAEVFELRSHKSYLVISSQTKDVPKLSETLLTKPRQSQKVMLFPMHTVSHLSFCARSPKVIYGAF